MHDKKNTMSQQDQSWQSKLEKKTRAKGRYVKTAMKQEAGSSPTVRTELARTRASVSSLSLAH